MKIKQYTKKKKKNQWVEEEMTREIRKYLEMN